MKGRLAERSLADLEQTLERFGQVCGDRMLANIAPRMVEEHFSARLQMVSPATANRDLRTLKASFNRAIGRGYLERNPAAGLKQVRELSAVTQNRPRSGR